VSEALLQGSPLVRYAQDTDERIFCFSFHLFVHTVNM